jgi:hypothetical protein
VIWEADAGLSEEMADEEFGWWRGAGKHVEAVYLLSGKAISS